MRARWSRETVTAGASPTSGWPRATSSARCCSRCSTRRSRAKVPRSSWCSRATARARARPSTAARCGPSRCQRSRPRSTRRSLRRGSRTVTAGRGSAPHLQGRRAHGDPCRGLKPTAAMESPRCGLKERHGFDVPSHPPAERAFPWRPCTSVRGSTRDPRREIGATRSTRDPCRGRSPRPPSGKPALRAEGTARLLGRSIHPPVRSGHSLGGRAISAAEDARSAP